MHFHYVYAAKMHCVPRPPPVDVGVDAEEILRCRGGFGSAEAELRSLRRLQLSSTGPLFFKEALAAHEAKI